MLKVLLAVTAVVEFRHNSDRVPLTNQPSGFVSMDAPQIARIINCYDFVQLAGAVISAMVVVTPTSLAKPLSYVTCENMTLASRMSRSHLSRVSKCYLVRRLE